MNKILEIKSLDFSYHTLSGETKAIENVSFDVYENEFIGIIGPSGSGKSTILSLIFGLLTPTSGQICTANLSHNTGDTPIGYMLQKDHLFEWRSIYKNITLGLEINHQLTQEKKEFIEQMLSDYDLSGFKNARPSQLSGGMRQRAALIRTLALKPSMLLLDEPFSALDSQTRLAVAEDIYNILRKEHKSAVLVTHDISEAISFCDRVVILSKRPGTVKKIIPICLSVSKKTPLKARSAPEFKDYFNMLWEELHDEG
ncbi:MAG: ABC transporter ATP-binding protein [Clostridiales bacterium]|nr:ABC transporter ATP-binding protein [Clostridiales bacterium]